MYIHLLGSKIATQRSWERAWTWQIPKSGFERVQKVLWAKGLKGLLHWCKRELHGCKTGFWWCKRLLGDLCTLAPKHLWHPFRTTLGTFEVSGPCSRHSGSQESKNSQNPQKKKTLHRFPLHMSNGMSMRTREKQKWF